jgi:hypothetical protein
MPATRPISTLATFALAATIPALAAAQNPSALPSAPLPAVAALLAQVNPARPTPGGQRDAKESAPEAQPGPLLTMAPHPDGTRYWISGQANSIFQMHGHFHSPYEGTNSL